MTKSALEWKIFLLCLSFHQRATFCLFQGTFVVSISGTSSALSPFFDGSIWSMPKQHHHRILQTIGMHRNHRHPLQQYSSRSHNSNAPIASSLHANTPNRNTPPEPNRKPSKNLKKRRNTKARKTTPNTDGGKKNPQKEPNSNPMKTILFRAVAKASADREAAADTANSLKYTKNINEKQEKTDDVDVGSLKELTQAIDKELYIMGQVAGPEPRLEGIIQNARDNMTSLLGFNQEQGDWKTHVSSSTYNVAIVFGKKLVRDQVTVEYAARIRTLARLFVEEPKFRPSLVCFCGGVGAGNHVSDADAGCIFFRHMCEVQGIDLDGVEILIDNKSQNDEKAVFYLTEKVKSKYIYRWLERTSDTDTAEDEYGEGLLVRKKVNVHFTLISTEYHLCNINDVHHRSPQRSLLSLMEGMGGAFKDRNNYGYSEDNYFRSPYDSTLEYREIQDGPKYDYYSYRQDRDDQNSFDVYDNDDMFPVTRGIVSPSWSFQYATYPYLYAKDDATVFLGKCYLLGEELNPLLVNMKGVVDQKEFFQRDNYLMLASIRRSLVDHLEDLHKPGKTYLHKAIKTHYISLQNGRGNTNENGRDTIAVLEMALVSLGRCVDLVKPAGLLMSTVPKADWVKALGALEESMREIRYICDPDRPLHPTGWGKLVDDNDEA